MVAPAFKIEVNGEDVTHKIKPFITSINLTDNEKDEADELVITVSKKFKRPSYKDEIKIWLGYGSNQIFAGLFFVQTTSIKDNKALTINATGVDFGSGIKEKRSENYDVGTLAQLADIIAKRHSLKLRTDADVLIGGIQQDRESDINLLTNLAREHNLVFNIKNNTLYLINKIADVPKISVDIDKCIDSDIAYSNKKLYKSCRATYHNTKTNKTHTLVAGSGNPVLNVNKQFVDDTEALLCAQNTLVRANKSTEDGNLTMAGKVCFAGSELALGGSVYQVKKVAHTLSKAWKTTIDFESYKSSQ